MKKKEYSTAEYSKQPVAFSITKFYFFKLYSEEHKSYVNVFKHLVKLFRLTDIPPN
jgi:hypothetical protein